jgi:outer membrane protein assembly factor BamB
MLSPGVRRVAQMTLTICAGALIAGIAPPNVALPDTAAVSAPAQWTQFRFNSQRNPVIAMDATPSWTVETHSAISASPSLVDGIVFLGNNRGTLYAIDVRSGHVLWTHRFTNPLMSNPLVYDGVVIVGEGNSNSTTYVPRRQVQVGNGPNALIGLEAQTGKQVWRVPLSGTGMPTPAIVNGLLVHHNGNGGILAFDLHTQRIVYRRIVKSVASMVGLLPFSADLVVTSGIFPNRVFAVRPATGSIAWEYRLSANDSGVGDCPPVSDGSRVFGDYIAPAAPNAEAGVGTIGVERVYALDATTGRPTWNIALESGIVPPENETAIPLVVGTRLYAGSAVAPYVHAIDTETGKVLWRFKTGGPVKGGIVAVGQRIYFGDLAGNLWAVDAASGSLVGTLKTATRFNVGSPIVAGRSLIIGSETGSIAALPLERIDGGRSDSH